MSVFATNNSSFPSFLLTNADYGPTETITATTDVKKRRMESTSSTAA